MKVHLTIPRWSMSIIFLSDDNIYAHIVEFAKGAVLVNSAQSQRRRNVNMFALFMQQLSIGVCMCSGQRW